MSDFSSEGAASGGADNDLTHQTISPEPWPAAPNNHQLPSQPVVTPPGVPFTPATPTPPAHNAPVPPWAASASVTAFTPPPTPSAPTPYAPTPNPTPYATTATPYATTTTPYAATVPFSPPATPFVPPQSPPSTNAAAFSPFAAAVAPSPSPVAPTARPKSAKRGTALLISALLVGGLAGAGAGFVAGGRADNNTAASNNSSFAPPPSGGIVTTPKSVQEILAKVEPAIVSITTIGPSGPEGAGTGIILTKDGEIVTNAHVIEGGVSFEITLDGQKDTVVGELIGSEPDSDVALIKITPQSLAQAGLNELPVAELGDSDLIQVGDPVVAIGNALALAGGPSVTSGIVSAKNRSLRDAGVVLEDLVQTDAAINPGNSGGPLVNAVGQVIGMNTAVIQQAGNTAIAQNIGFAISANTFKPIVDDIRNGGGSVRPRAYLGVSAENNSPTLATKYGFDTTTGAVVAAVEAGSPADDAKLERLDVITEFDGETVRDASDLVELVRDHAPGERVAVTFERNRKSQSVEVELGARP